MWHQVHATPVVQRQQQVAGASIWLWCAEACRAFCWKGCTLAGLQPQVQFGEITSLPGGVHNVSSTPAYAVQVIP